VRNQLTSPSKFLWFCQKFEGGRYTFDPQVYSFYFDVMPKWEKTWRERMMASLDMSEKIAKESLELNSRMKDLTETMTRLTWLIAGLTVLGIFVTILVGKRGSSTHF